MNQFSLHLSHIEGYGGVVGINATITVPVIDNSGLPDIVDIRVCWKQKSGKLTAAVNAFHMHRGLCKEFTKQFVMIPDIVLSTRGVRSVKQGLARVVKEAYCLRQQAPYQQWYSFYLEAFPDECLINLSVVDDGDEFLRPIFLFD